MYQNENPKFDQNLLLFFGGDVSEKYKFWDSLQNESS